MHYGLYVALVDHPIVVPSLVDDANDPDVGAIAWFLGVTRRNTGDRVTDTLFYEAHRPMAKRSLEDLANLARERFGLRYTVIIHRLGEVPVGQASVLVGSSSPHRRWGSSTAPELATRRE